MYDKLKLGHTHKTKKTKHKTYIVINQYLLKKDKKCIYNYKKKC